MANPTDLKYTNQHEWLDIQGDVATVGITEFAAEALGDIVYVDLPTVGATLTAGGCCGEIESTKSVSELYAPGDGEVLEVNAAVGDDPGLLNNDPFGQGWIFKFRVSRTPGLLDSSAYDALIAQG